MHPLRWAPHHRAVFQRSPVPQAVAQRAAAQMSSCTPLGPCSSGWPGAGPGGPVGGRAAADGRSTEEARGRKWRRPSLLPPFSSRRRRMAAAAVGQHVRSGHAAAAGGCARQV